MVLLHSSLSTLVPPSSRGLSPWASRFPGLRFYMSHVKSLFVAPPPVTPVVTRPSPSTPQVRSRSPGAPSLSRFYPLKWDLLYLWNKRKRSSRRLDWDPCSLSFVNCVYRYTYRVGIPLVLNLVPIHHRHLHHFSLLITVQKTSYKTILNDSTSCTLFPSLILLRSHTTRLVNLSSRTDKWLYSFRLSPYSYLTLPLS